MSNTKTKIFLKRPVLEQQNWQVDFFFNKIDPLQMNLLQFEQLVREIHQEQSNPGPDILTKCLDVLENLPFILSSNQNNLHSADYSLNYKRSIDYITWSFSQIFNRAKEADPYQLINCYKKLSEINSIKIESGEIITNVDYTHCREFSNPLEKLVQLYTQLGDRAEAEIYRKEEIKNKVKLAESNELFKKGIDLLCASQTDEKSKEFLPERLPIIEDAVANFKASLALNPYNTRSRILLGFINSVNIVTEKINQSFGKREPFSGLKATALDYAPAGIPLFHLEEVGGGLNFNFGPIFQEKYYFRTDPNSLSVKFKFNKFSESNNQVFRYERDFSSNLEAFMVDYSHLFKSSAFKVYGNADLYNDEIASLDYFSHILKVPRIIRRISSPLRIVEFSLIEGQSMYDLFRELETGSYEIAFKEKIESALIDKHLEHLVKIQEATPLIAKKINSLKEEKSDYRKKLRAAFFDQKDFSGKDSGLILLLQEHFSLKIDYPNTLDRLGEELNQLAEKEELVIYKDASPRNTKLDYKLALEELGLRSECEIVGKKQGAMLYFLQEKYKQGLDLERIAFTLAESLHQLDFEKIGRLGFEFDDVIETLEFPFFNPLKQGEKVWEKKFHYFLSLKGKAGKAEELKENYNLVALNRHVRWLYYLMKWYDREICIDPIAAKQHLSDFKTHVKSAQRIISDVKIIDGKEIQRLLDKIDQTVT